MSTSTRENLLGKFATLLEGIDWVSTVVVTRDPLTLLWYKQEDLPLFEVRAPREAISEMHSLREKSTLEVEATLHYLDFEWNVDYEAYIEDVRQTVAANYTLDQTAVDTRLIEVNVEGLFPLYKITFHYEIDYYVEMTDV